MNITYIIGNGFDLGLDLKTSYRDFVNAYLYMTSKGAVWFSKLQRILRNYDAASTWADAEIEFAKLQFTHELNAGSNFDREMLQVAEEFRTELEKYLKCTTETAENREIAPEMSLMFRRRLIDSIVEGINGCGASHDVIRFDSQNSIDVINFNYTIIFDNLFYGTSNINDRKFDCNFDGKQCEFSVGSVNHIHGTLMSGNTLFGVSSSEQIVDVNARKLSEKTGMLIKSNLDKERNGFLYRGAEGSLENSDVVVAFGTSFGGSDKFWWNKLAELIIRKPKFRLYIFSYSPKPQAITNTVDRALLQSEWRGRFLSSISDEMDRETYSKLVDNMYKIEVLSCGPFTRLATGEKLLGDPLDLNYFAKKLNTIKL